MLTFYPFQITDQGVKKAPNLDPQHWITASFNKCNQCGGSRIRNVYPGSDFFPSWIQDPNCLHPWSPDPGSSSQNLSILTHKKHKNGFKALKNMIRVVHPGFWIRMLTFSHPHPSWICNTEWNSKNSRGICLVTCMVKRAVNWLCPTPFRTPHPTKSNKVSSVADPWHFCVDLGSRIHASY